jgi:hypothetical protein
MQEITVLHRQLAQIQAASSAGRQLQVLMAQLAACISLLLLQQRLDSRLAVSFSLAVCTNSAVLITIQWAWCGWHMAGNFDWHLFDVSIAGSVQGGAAAPDPMSEGTR